MICPVCGIRLVDTEFLAPYGVTILLCRTCVDEIYSKQNSFGHDSMYTAGVRVDSLMLARLCLANELALHELGGVLASVNGYYQIGESEIPVMQALGLEVSGLMNQSMHITAVYKFDPGNYVWFPAYYVTCEG